MGPSSVLIALIVIGLPTVMIFALASRLFRYREKKLELEAQIAAANAGVDAKLEQRLRVLERIVTDKGMGVADEIERLRDERVG